MYQDQPQLDVRGVGFESGRKVGTVSLKLDCRYLKSVLVQVDECGFSIGRQLLMVFRQSGG